MPAIEPEAGERVRVCWQPEAEQMGRSNCPTGDPVLLTVPLARDDLIQIKGTIVEALAGGNYRVKGDNGMEFLAKIGGRMRRYHIRVIPGDRVTIAVSPYDPSHGLIVFRG